MNGTTGNPDAEDRRSQHARDEETERRTKGQRRVSMLWEVVHAVISVIVTGGTVYVAGALVLRGDTVNDTAFLVLTNAFFMVVSSYFARTNHIKVGGVGKEYEGR